MDSRVLPAAFVLSLAFARSAPAGDFVFPVPPALERLMKVSPRKPIDPHELIRNAARKHKLPPALVKSIAAAESAFRLDALSPKGAVGLMQVMPATGQDLGLDVRDPEENVEAGTHYLSLLWNRYRNRCRDWLKRVIAAYNAGPGAVDKYRGVPPYSETRAYVARVLQYYKLYKREG